MLNILSTLEMIRTLSLSATAEDFAKVFARYLSHTTSVNRGLVIRWQDQGASSYYIELCANWNAGQEGFTESHPDGVFQGGLLAQLLKTGELRFITELVVTPDETARTLLDGFRALVAFPLFEKGNATGAMILLSRQPWALDAGELCGLAMMSGMLDRAVSANALAQKLQDTCSALDRELLAAADVQRWLLPSALPDLPGFALAASYCTARHSGGDYYDVLRLPNNKILLMIADVSGKGAPAAVLTAVIRTIVHVDPAHWEAPELVLSALNESICALHSADRSSFVTAFCALLDTTTGRLTYSSAGHLPPRLVRGEPAEIIELDAYRSLPLGIDSKTCFSSGYVQLLPSDRVILYTDGIIEAIAEEWELFGLHRLDAVLRATSQKGPGEVVQAIQDAVGNFSRPAALTDDQTLLVLGINEMMHAVCDVPSRTAVTRRNDQNETLRSERLFTHCLVQDVKHDYFN